MPRILIILILALGGCTACFAGQNTLYFDNLLSYRYEYASDRTEDLLVDRLTARGLFDFGTGKIRGGVAPFLEIRRHLRLKRWYMSSLGTGTKLASRDLAAFDLNLQYTWMDVPAGYFIKHPSLAKDRIEINPVLNLDLPLYNHGLLRLYLSGVDSAYYDIEHQDPVRNELGAGLKLVLNKQLSLGLGWYHTDWIHDFDSDQAEISARILFP